MQLDVVDQTLVTYVMIFYAQVVLVLILISVLTVYLMHQDLLVHVRLDLFYQQMVYRVQSAQQAAVPVMEFPTIYAQLVLPIISICQGYVSQVVQWATMRTRHSTRVI